MHYGPEWWVVFSTVTGLGAGREVLGWWAEKEIEQMASYP